MCIRDSPLQGLFVVRGLGLAAVNLYTKYEVSMFTHYEDIQEALLSQRDHAMRLSVEILQQNIAIVWHYLRDPMLSRFYRATPCQARYMPSSCVCLSVCLCVCVCVCLPHSGIVSKRLNVGSRK